MQRSIKYKISKDWVLFGSHLRVERKARGFTQAQIAELLDITQLDVSSAEHGANMTQRQATKKLSEFLGVAIPGAALISANVKPGFVFRQIEGQQTLEEVTATLANLARNIQNTHVFNNTNKDMLQRLFDIRKKGVDACMELIQRYIDQVPDEEFPVAPRHDAFEDYTGGDSRLNKIKETR